MNARTNLPRLQGVHVECTVTLRPRAPKVKEKARTGKERAPTWARYEMIRSYACVRSRSRPRRRRTGDS
jgi:hypothetical protein